MTVCRARPSRSSRRRGARGASSSWSRVVLVVVGYLAFSSIGNALVYYLTPTELLDRGEAGIGQTVRLGGIVAEGSVSGPATDLTFVDHRRRRPRSRSTRPWPRPARSARAAAPSSRARCGEDGIFEATQVIVKHDENYEAPEPGAQPSDRYFEPGTSDGR